MKIIWYKNKTIKEKEVACRGQQRRPEKTCDAYYDLF